MEKELLQQADAYFKKYPVYAKLFPLMKQKYASLGHLGGSFSLSSLTAEERSILSGFTGMDLPKDGDVHLTFAKLKHALEKSRFGKLTWESILEQYDGASLSIKKEVRLRQLEEKHAFWESCLAECENEDVRAWMAGILLEQKSGYRLMEKQFSADRERLRQLWKTMAFALGRLPIDSGQKQLLPVFAAQVAGNPHYFDDGSAAGSLLLNYGAYRFGQADAALSGIEQRESLLYQMGILKDDLSNTCLAYGILGIHEDGSIHEGLQGFFMEQQALPITLHTLSRLWQLAPAEDIKCQNDAKAYIVENPAAFSTLIGKYPTHAFLCTTGQLKLASYAALDLFPEDCVFYYAGDFDPEGLQIAQGLKQRYGQRLVLWNYKKEHYQQAISSAASQYGALPSWQDALSSARLKKLDKIEIPQLQEIKQCLLTHKRAAYQEQMLDSYLL